MSGELKFENKDKKVENSLEPAQQSPLEKSQFESQPGHGFGIIHFITLKILFLDLFISLGDAASDFAQVGFSTINRLIHFNRLKYFPSLSID